MKSMWIALVVCILLLTAAVLHVAWYFPDLPERMASHFDARGVADGFASKLDVVRFSMMMTFGVMGLLVLVGILIQCCPAALMDFPNKDYWFSPSESRRTRNWSTGHIFWMADATALFFIGMNQATFQANLGGPPRLGYGFFVWLGLYCAFMIAWCFLPFWRFRKPTSK